MKLSTLCSWLMSLTAVALVLPLAAEAKDDVGVANLRCDYSTNPVGIDDVQPRLGWRLVADRRGVSQSAYEIQVEGGVSLDEAAGVSGVVQAEGETTLSVGSGRYTFSWPLEG